ncbi:MAG: hypothetical protein IJI22_01230 [Bacilli bacterium]|nr:hypothetical protein [Bacilli bacterium]
MEESKKKSNIPPVVIALICITIALIAIGIVHMSKNKYDIFNTKKDVSKKIGYSLPKEFEKTFAYDDMVSYSYSENGYSCHFSVSVSEFDNYKDGKSYLESTFNHTLSDEVSEIEEQNINGDTWYSIRKESENGYITYEYSSVKNGKVYDAEYSIFDYGYEDSNDNDDNLCLTAQNEIIKSLKIKETN